ncbi:MAG: YkgJ family cysteine cluster protein [Candidatus Tectimicrobiota bacterium]
MSEAYAHYQNLVAKVAAFGEAICQQYPTQVTCHAGCDGCCYQHFTVFPVEAYALAQAVAALSMAERQELQAQLQQTANPWAVVETPSPCVLLAQGRCRLYQGRPLICRMHGFPLASSMIERPDGLQRDCCPLNFSAVPLQDIASQAVYNLDLVNQTLVAINHLFIREHQLPDQRVTMRQAVLTALTMLVA